MNDTTGPTLAAGDVLSYLGSAPLHSPRCYTCGAYLPYTLKPHPDDAHLYDGETLNICARCANHFQEEGMTMNDTTKTPNLPRPATEDEDRLKAAAKFARQVAELLDAAGACEGIGQEQLRRAIDAPVQPDIFAATKPEAAPAEAKTH